MSTQQIPTDTYRTKEWHEEARCGIKNIVKILDLPHSVKEAAIQIINEHSKHIAHTNCFVGTVCASATIIATRIHRDDVAEKILSKDAAYAASESIGESTDRVTKEDVETHIRYIQSELSLTVPVETPTEFLSRLTNRLDMSQQSEKAAKRLIEEIEDQGHHSGQSPSGVAGAAVYIAAKETGTRKKQNQADIAEVVDISEVTLRKTRDYIRNEVDVKSTINK